MGLMSLAIGSGSIIQLIVDGNDENEAIDRIGKLYQQQG